MKVRWLPRALENRRNQILYLTERNPRAAIALGDAIDAATQQLKAYPASGRPGRMRRTRELVVPGTPLILVYRVDDEAVRILRLLHGAQKWPPGHSR